MHSEYVSELRPIGQREVFMRYNHMYLMKGCMADDFSPQEALTLLEWLEQHRHVFEQACRHQDGSREAGE